MDEGVGGIRERRIMKRIKISDIIPDPNQPRKTFNQETLAELKESLQGTGLVQPITVRPIAGEKYMIIIGERRFRAALMAGSERIDCIVREDVDDKQAREMQFAENYHLEPLPPMEQARAWHKHIQKYNLTLREFADIIGLHFGTVSSHLSLVTDLSVILGNEVDKGTLTYREAREIAKVKNPTRQEEIARPFIEGKVASTYAPEIVKQARDHPTRSMDEIIDEVAGTTTREQFKKDKGFLKEALQDLPVKERFDLVATGVSPAGKPQPKEPKERSWQEFFDEAWGRFSKAFVDLQLIVESQKFKDVKVAQWLPDLELMTRTLNGLFAKAKEEARG